MCNVMFEINVFCTNLKINEQYDYDSCVYYDK